MAVVLHDYWRSSAAYRVRIGLSLLDLSFAAVPVDLMSGQQRSARNLAHNPQGFVPSLEIDGLRLTQSLAILEYLNESRNAGWLPKDVGHRAKVRAVAYAVAMDIHPICNLHVVRHAVALGGTTTEAWMQHFITEGFSGLEGLLAQVQEGPDAAGDAVNLADICLVPQVYNAKRWGVDLARFPRIAAREAQLTSLAAFAAAHPDRAKPAA